MLPLLICLPVANALEIAGRWLTDKVLADLKQQGRRVTPFEAEDLKISQPRTWEAKPFMREWSGMISDHVAEYTRTIRDEVCLPNNPALEVVITGGSSAVEPMRTAVLEGVTGALETRGLDEGFSRATSLLSASSLSGMPSGYREVQVAQLAVALGASDPYLSELKAYPEGLLASPRPSLR